MKKKLKNFKAEEGDYKEIVNFVRDGDAIHRIRIEAEGHMDEAAGFLDYFPDSVKKENLLALNRFLIKRRY